MIRWWRDFYLRSGRIEAELQLSWIKKQQFRQSTVTHACNPVVGGLRQRPRGHQSFGEARILSKPAATQQTRVERLSTENKGGFPYIPFSAGYRNGVGGLQLVPYITTCYFTGYFNLWGEGTLLWSPDYIPQLWFSFISL
jgi:hypothetical protein